MSRGGIASGDGDSTDTYDLTGPSRPLTVDATRTWAHAAARAADEYDAWQTSPEYGDELLRERLAETVRSEPDRVLVTAGVRATAAMFARRCRTVVIEAPTFAGVLNVFRDLGCQVTLCPWESLPDEQERREPDLVWLTSPCRNPDGLSLAPTLLDEVTSRAGPGWVVVNEVYRWYSAEPTEGNCFFVGSFSKLTGGGGRVGWLRNSAAPFEPTPAERSSSPARMLQRTWAYFLAAQGLQLCGEAVVEPTLAAATTFRLAAGLPAGPTKAAPFLALEVAPGRSEESMVQTLAERGLRIGPGADFHSPVAAIRICFTGVTPSQAEEAGKRLRPFIHDGVLALAGSVAST